MGAASTRGRRLLICLLSCAAFIPGRCLFEGDVLWNKYGIFRRLGRQIFPYLI